MEKKTITTQKLENLKLDVGNPRFAELYAGSSKEEDLIEYLLYTESGEDIAKAISVSKEFYPDRPLWVIKQGAEYLVRDGNRRCAAVKALQQPNKYTLGLPKFKQDSLPVIIFKDKKELERRIIQEHTANLFKEWDRIAKALEVFRLHKSGSSVDSMKEIDSSPSDLIKLASFYYEAVKIKGDELKHLLRRGRGNTGGKAIIFERLFKYKDDCGYGFKNKPSYEIEINNPKRFSQYVAALVDYLKANPLTAHKEIDDDGQKFLRKLKTFGFDVGIKSTKGNTKTKTPVLVVPVGYQKNKRKSVKSRPYYTRKKIPAPLDKLIAECYDLDPDNFANAKTALVRVSFECTLKYVVENTEYKPNKLIADSLFFRDAFFDKTGKKRTLTNFDVLKTLFTKLISNTGIRKAFENFDLEHPHQIIHNYRVGGVPTTATALCDNLIDLIEFMLQEENDLLTSLDQTKL